MKLLKFPAILLAASALHTGSVHAATIIFTTNDITGDSNISTTGTGLFAYNVNRDDGVSTTINGVTFDALATIPLTAAGGPLTINSALSTNGVNFGGGTGLSTQYQALLATADYGGNPARTLTLNNLTVGQTYQLQLFAQDSRSSGSGRNETIANVGGGGGVVLDYNSTEAVGGLGDFALGTFTADATTQQFTLTGGGNNTQISVNGIQLRNITPVPEPSAALLGALGMLALLRRRR